MSYAVIQTGGKQYKVKAGEIIKIEKLDKYKPESKLELFLQWQYSPRKALVKLYKLKIIL